MIPLKMPPGYTKFSTTTSNKNSQEGFQASDTGGLNDASNCIMNRNLFDQGIISNDAASMLGGENQSLVPPLPVF